MVTKEGFNFSYKALKSRALAKKGIKKTDRDSKPNREDLLFLILFK